jgi:hypothetical protein
MALVVFSCAKHDEKTTFSANFQLRPNSDVGFERWYCLPFKLNNPSKHDHAIQTTH